MQAFQTLNGLVAPLAGANINTDAIIPKQFLKSIHRSGFGNYLFDEWRYLDHGEPGMDCQNRPLNPDFVLNLDRYQDASILLAHENFGCGSSREHAPWALEDYGFRALIAPSYADIFYNNCFKNGVLPIILAADRVDQLFAAVTSTPGYCLEIDLPAEEIRTPDAQVISFEIDPYKKNCLLEGLDEIALTLQHTASIQRYEARRQKESPWLFVAPT